MTPTNLKPASQITQTTSKTATQTSSAQPGTYAPLNNLGAISFTDLNPSNAQNHSQTQDSVKKFLQGQLTCDLNEVSETQSRPFAHCNLQGRMTSLGRIILNQGQYFLILPRSILQETLKNLQKYANFSKIRLQEKSDLFFYGLEIQRLYESKNTPNFFSIALNQFCGINQVINQASNPISPESSEKNSPIFLCVEINSHHTRALIISHHPLEFNPKTYQQKPEFWWLASEIQNLTAYLTPKTLGKFLPHDINLPEQQGVSFTKGCFLGQEIIARMEHLGKLKKQMIIEIIEIIEITEADFQKSPENHPEEVICECEYEQKIYRLKLTKKPSHLD